VGFAYKQVIVVRRDLGMGAGKTAAQAAHAAVLGLERAYRMRPAWVDAWRADGMPKVVLQVPGEAELADVCARAEAAGLPVALVRDRGLTQVAAGTVTCAGIGPAGSAEIDEVTGNLRLL
jgi:peptidyl-tRNA hydrolase, PTH2 family